VGRTDTLLELQDTDAVIDRLTKRLTEIKTSLRETDQLIAARQARHIAEQSEARRRAVRKDLELAAGAVDDKIQLAEKRLYSGAVKNPKELLDLQNDISALKRQKTKLDEQLFNAMLEVEEAEIALQQRTDDLAQIEASWRHSQSDLIIEQTQLEANLANEHRDQATARAALSAPDLALYDQLRRRKAGVAVVELNGQLCGGCGVRVTGSVIQQLSQGDQFARCGNCERIIVRPS
jgi:predicted  nucleic acid-binding Zn-ribbon protein